MDTTRSIGSLESPSNSCLATLKGVVEGLVATVATVKTPAAARH